MLHWFSKSTDPQYLSISDSSQQLAVFTRQLQVLLDSGVTLLRALRILEGQVEDQSLGLVVRGLSERVEKGLALSQAMSAYPRVFTKVAVGLVLSGESTGRLAEVLSKLADMLEREGALKKKLTAALSYPALVLSVTLVLTLFVFYAILPNFIAIFREQNIQLPLLTRVLILITDSVRNPGAWLMTLGLLLVGYLLVRKTLQKPGGAALIEQLLAKIPIIGPSLRFASLARFCWVMESLCGSGVPLLRCVEMSTRASGSAILEQYNKDLCQDIREGLGMGDRVRQHPEIYGRVMPQMIAMAEESGGFEVVFGRLATWYNSEMEGRLELLKATIEPLLMAVVAVIVGTIVIGIFLPLYSIVGSLGA